MSQLGFSDVKYEVKRKKTNRKILLSEMDSVVHLDSAVKLIELVYPKPALGRLGYLLPSRCGQSLLPTFY